jgi:hypothetical protein
MPGLTDKADSTKNYDQLWMGLDVGSTTVKVVVIDGDTDTILWADYQRHETKQPEKAIEMLKAIAGDFPNTPIENIRVFITGSGGSGIAKHIGAKFVQEVNAVSLAVEKLYPACGSVIELGGQDAKIIIFKEDPETGKKKKLPSMNDKCAGGTGAVIDKINAKLRIPSDQLCQMGYKGLKLHPVAGKCGVFAEADINGLQKQGVPPDELMASLFESIVQQNLSVLTRGNTLRPVVLLLGGPNCYIKGMRDCWKVNIPKIWEERNYPLPEGVNPEDLITTPASAPSSTASRKTPASACISATTSWSGTSPKAAPRKKPKRAAPRPSRGVRKNSTISRRATPRRNSPPPPSSPDRWSKASWALTAVPLPPRLSSLTRTATSSARRTSFRAAIRSRTPRRSWPK